MNLVLGIDTGGTYTDGVLLKYESRRVLATHKSLTTKRDFAIGIESVIDGIHIEDPMAIKMVSISTTLATNAIAEGKGKRVGLILIGYDPELLAKFDMERRLATPRYHFFAGGHTLHGQEKEPLDLAGILAWVTEIQHQVDALAVSSYFSPLNPEHENRVQTAVSRICNLPIVLGHQLSTKLGSVERATTAALNASLLAVLREFVIAVRWAMARRQIDAPLMVVRGDGTLMSDEFAAVSPVETIHSGPAASAIGGRFLSELDDALVIDVGGTTTDIALIEKGQVTVSEVGATVGGYKTAVHAANLLSIALGGDSHIHLDREGTLLIGPERVTPLACLAATNPAVAERIQQLSHRSWAHTSPDWLEHWFLLRKPPPGIALSPREEALLDLLQEEPLPLPEILQRLDVLHARQLNVHALWQQEVIGRAGMTPTDLLHLEGRQDTWHADTSRLTWELFCRYQFVDQDVLRQQVWTQITETVIRAILSFLTDKTLSLGKNDADEIGRWFFHNSLQPSHPQLETQIRLRRPIIGIGAPAGFFLPPVAKLLHTDLILPDHYPVANAVGSIAGSVMVAEELLVYPKMSAKGLDVIGYFVQTSQQRVEFEELGKALDYARQLSRERALAAALRSGADDPQVSLKEVTDGLDTYRIRARAVGNPRLSR